MAELHQEYEGVIEMIYARRMRFQLSEGRWPAKAILARDLWARWEAFLRDEGKQPGTVFPDMTITVGPYLPARTLSVE